jgi:CMP-N-acetylneuraminic acid synthetase
MWTYHAAAKSRAASPCVVLDLASPPINQQAVEPSIVRPPELCSGPATDVVRWIAEEYEPDEICMLLPTSPFRTAEHIDMAYAAWKASGADTLISVIPARTDALKDLSMSGHLIRSLAQFESNGAIQMATTENFLRYGFHYGGTMQTVQPYVMTPEDGLDIDTEGDWIEAERIYESRYGNAGLAGSDARQEPRQGAEGDPGLVEVHGKRWAWSPLHSGEVSTGATD